MLNRPWLRRGIKKWIKESEYLRYTQLIWPDYRLWLRKAGTLPSFLVIGAQRAGTTFLHERLASATSANPSPIQKEVHYFDNKYYKSIEWYKKFFETEKGNKKNFETSPYYLYHPAVPKRVKSTIPNADLVVVLRDPVERAISHYKWMYQNKLEHRSALEAFKDDAEKISLEGETSYLKKFDDPLYFDFNHIYKSYIRRSLYHIQLKRWINEFDSSKLYILKSSDLFEDTKNAMKYISSCLGLSYRKSKVESINKNRSKNNIVVSEEARKLAGCKLSKVWSKVKEITK